MNGLKERTDWSRERIYERNNNGPWRRNTKVKRRIEKWNYWEESRGVHGTWKQIKVMSQIYCLSVWDCINKDILKELILLIAEGRYINVAVNNYRIRRRDQSKPRKEWK